MIVERVRSGECVPARAPLKALSDRLIFGTVLVALLVVTGLPGIYGYVIARGDAQFMGIVLNVPDTAQYFAWARDSAQALIIGNKLTPEPGQPAYFNLFWFIVGRLSAALGIGIAEGMQLIRPVAGAFYMTAIFWFVGLVTISRFGRWVAFLVVALGGGFGWVLVLLKHGSGVAFPLDVYTSEANTFLTVTAFPHQATATGLLVLMFGVAVLAFERRSFALAVAAGVAGLFLGVQHGYDLIVAYVVIGVTGLLLALRNHDWRRQVLLVATMCGMSGPAALYLVFLTTESPIWRGVLAQYGNAGVYTPTPPHLIILLGLPLIIAAGTLATRVARRPADFRHWVQQSTPREFLLWTWFVAGLLLLYIPTNFPIKMLGGLQIPLGIIATRIVLSAVERRTRRLGSLRPSRLQSVLGVCLIVAVLPVNAYLFAWRFVDLHRQQYPYYLERDDVAALHWLEENSDPSDVVLSSLTIGEYIPSVSGNTAFLAHWAQTLDFYTKLRLASVFFNPAYPDAERAAILQRFRVRYVFYGDPERALGTYDPGGSALLERVFSTPHASVYRVKIVPAWAGAALGSPGA